MAPNGVLNDKFVVHRNFQFDLRVVGNDVLGISVLFCVTFLAPFLAPKPRYFVKYI